MGNVLVLLNLHNCDRQEATNQGNEKLKRWLKNPNRNFNETNVPRSALTSQTRGPPMKNLQLTMASEEYS